MGTTIPSAKLDIYGSSNSADNMIELINSKYDSTNTTGETGILFGWNNHVAARITAFKEGTVNRTGFKIIGEAGYNVPTTIATFRSTGNVGIGTSSPSAKIQVNDATSSKIRFLDTSDFYYTDYGRDGIDAYTNTNSSAPIFFKTGGSEKMRITSSGNVGINESNPITKLDVNSGVARTVNTKTYTQFLHTDDADDFQVGFATAIKGGTTSADRYVSLEAASYQKSTSTYSGELALALNPLGGNVGIGTTSPTSLLEISKQLSAASAIDYPYTISSRDDGNSINQQGGEGVGIKFRIAGNDGTTPGNSLVGASIAAIREMPGDTDSSTGLGFFITQNNETLDEALRIDHDGNVGIGTTSPSRLLTVEQTDGFNNIVGVFKSNNSFKYSFSV